MRSRIQRRLAEREANDALLRTVLAATPTAKDNYLREWTGTSFERLYRRSRKVFDPRTWLVMTRLRRFERRWVRSPETWKARGHSPEAVMRSLVRHLLCAYPTPAWWFELWLRPAEVLAPRAGGHRPVDPFDRGEAECFIAVAGGGSFRALSDLGALPVPLTRRECHVLRQQYGVAGLVHAVRKTQIERRGGHRALVRAVLDSAWGDAFARRGLEVERAAALDWLCRRAPPQLGHLPWLLHFLDHRPRGYRLAGREMEHVMRDVVAWQAEGAPPLPLRRRAVDVSALARWPASGWMPWREGGQSIVELRTRSELVAEGRSMQHCVAGYVHVASAGHSSIWSYRIEGARRLTIEVINPTRSLSQVRGRHNRMPTATELSVVVEWANRNGLRVPSG